MFGKHRLLFLSRLQGSENPICETNDKYVFILIEVIAVFLFGQNDNHYCNKINYYNYNHTSLLWTANVDNVEQMNFFQHHNANVSTTFFLKVILTGKIH